ncbi:MAG: Maf family protein [Deltaproteobacteria bacterium]|nr:Maf family protein [Deltaproteobacteria bacterium]
MTPPPLVLASTSRYRRSLVERLGVPFAAMAPDFDERAHDDAFERLGPHAFALQLARGKAASVARALVAAAGTSVGASATPADDADVCPRADGGRWILAADQLALLPAGADAPARLLHKPGTPVAAVEQLMTLAGREHRLVTAIVLRGHDGTEHHGVDEVVLHMRAFGRAEAEAYVDACAPLDCAGSYRVEDRGITLFRAIDGADPTSIMGLPLLLTASLLRRAGLLPGP